jgi:CBS domain-containing protein
MSCDDPGLRIRRIASGDGEVLTSLSVYCPLRSESVPLEECERCSFCEGVHYDDGEGRAFIRCRPTRAASRPATVWTRRPRKAVPTAADLTPLSSVMTADVVCVTPDLGLTALTTLLVERGFSGAPVVDAEGRPLGVVSKTDLLREPLTSRGTVGDVMMPLAFTLPETASLSQAAALMVEEGVHRLPVVSSEGKVIGLLSSFDVMRWIARESGYGAAR